MCARFLSYSNEADHARSSPPRRYLQSSRSFQEHVSPSGGWKHSSEGSFFSSITTFKLLLFDRDARIGGRYFGTELLLKYKSSVLNAIESSPLFLEQPSVRFFCFAISKSLERAQREGLLTFMGWSISILELDWLYVLLNTLLEVFEAEKHEDLSRLRSS